MKTHVQQMLITKARRFFKGLSSIRSAVFMAAILIASPLLANDVNLTFTTPTNKDQVHPAIVHVKIGDTDIPVQIPAGTTAPAKAGPNPLCDQQQQNPQFHRPRQRGHWNLNQVSDRGNSCNLYSRRYW